MDTYRYVVLRFTIRRRLHSCRCGATVRSASVVVSWTHHSTAKTRNWSRETAWWCSSFRTLRRVRYELRRQIWYSDTLSLVVVTCWNDLHAISISSTVEWAKFTSIISFLGKDRSGMSAALQAIRYPYKTRSTLSWAMINRSFCSLSSSRMIGSSRTATSW